jgi:hypothetical protein
LRCIFALDQLIARLGALDQHRINWARRSVADDDAPSPPGFGRSLPTPAAGDPSLTGT